MKLSAADMTCLTVAALQLDLARPDEADNIAAVAALVEQAAAQQWRLCELTPERRTLEQIFIELTCSETPLHEDAA